MEKLLIFLCGGLSFSAMFEAICVVKKAWFMLKQAQKWPLKNSRIDLADERSSTREVKIWMSATIVSLMCRKLTSNCVCGLGAKSIAKVGPFMS